MLCHDFLKTIYGCVCMCVCVSLWVYTCTYVWVCTEGHRYFGDTGILHVFLSLSSFPHNHTTSALNHWTVFPVSWLTFVISDTFKSSYNLINIDYFYKEKSKILMLVDWIIMNISELVKSLKNHVHSICISTNKHNELVAQGKEPKS